MTAVRASYRVKQFFRYFGSAVDGSRRTAALAFLPNHLHNLFFSMSPAAQAHHLSVFEQLREAGESDPDVLQAALLHDIGKGAVNPVERALIVLFAKIHPALPAGIAGNGSFGRAGLYRLAHHPAIGADLVHRTGGSERLVWLIRNHQQPHIADPGLRRLQVVDDQS